jgi:hypothetical protein
MQEVHDQHGCLGSRTERQASREAANVSGGKSEGYIWVCFGGALDVGLVDARDVSEHLKASVLLRAANSKWSALASTIMH